MSQQRTKTETPPRILIAGIGNIFLGDDAFGSEVARRLQRRAWPEGVRVVDFGIRGLDLAYALLDGCGLAILVDALPRGEVPGTLFVIEPEVNDSPAEEGNFPRMNGHAMDPVNVLQLVHELGGPSCGRILLVGCEPADLGGDEGRMGFSEPVAAVLDEACDIVAELVDQFLAVKQQQRVGSSRGVASAKET